MTVAYVSFCAEVVPMTTEGLVRCCADLAARGVSEINLLLTTPGGSVMHGIYAYNVLRALPVKLVCHNVGAINSIGNVLFLAGEERYASPGATFMFHGVGFDITTHTRFEEKNLRERMDSIQADQKKIAAILKARARFTDDAEVEHLFLEAATRDGQFAKDRGIIHDVREAKVPPGVPVVQLVFQR